MLEGYNIDIVPKQVCLGPVLSALIGNHPLQDYYQEYPHLRCILNSLRCLVQDKKVGEYMTKE